MNKEYRALLEETADKFNELQTKKELLQDLITDYKKKANDTDGLSRKAIETSVKKQSEINDLEQTLKAVEQQYTELVSNDGKSLSNQLREVKRAYINSKKEESRLGVEKKIAEGLAVIKEAIVSSDKELEKELVYFDNRLYNDFHLYLNDEGFERALDSYSLVYKGVARELLSESLVTERLGRMNNLDLEQL